MDEEADKVSLSDLQLSIMRALWALAHTTVATLLTRLEKRGLLSSQREGRQIFYTALMSESQIQRSMLADLLATVFRGNTPALLSHLVQEDEIKAEDLEKIRQLIEDKGGDHV